MNYCYLNKTILNWKRDSMDWQYMYLYKTDARRWHSFISEDHYQTGNMLNKYVNLSQTRLMRIGQGINDNISRTEINM